jgi:hypothetical protein
MAEGDVTGRVAMRRMLVLPLIVVLVVLGSLEAYGGENVWY